jgi:predicted lipoprotein with Yx(FWY)xxD motif
MKKPLAITLPLAAIAIAGCGSAYGSGTAPAPTSSGYGAASAARTAGAAHPHSGAALIVAHGKVGAYLADARGRALYLFEADKGTASTCYSACASVWPPLTATTKVTPGRGLSRTLVSSTKRTDGTTEVIYGGHPLYYYAADTAPASITGQGLNQFGGAWYLVAPNGKKIDGDGH